MSLIIQTHVTSIVFFQVIVDVSLVTSACNKMEAGSEKGRLETYCLMRLRVQFYIRLRCELLVTLLKTETWIKQGARKISTLIKKSPEKIEIN